MGSTLSTRDLAAPRRLDRAAAGRIRIYLASLLVDASTYSFSIGLACHAEGKLGASYWELGKLGALSAFAYSLGCLLTCGWSDRMGSLPLAFGSLALIGLTFLGTMLAVTYEHLLLAGAFMGLSLALFWPSIQRKLSLLSPGRTLWAALGVFNVLWAIGVGLGTVATPAVYASWGLRWTLFLGLLTALLAGAILCARMPEPSSAGPAEPPVGEEAARDRARLFLRLAWIANFTVFFAMVGVVRIFPRISSQLGIELGHMGWILVPLDLGKIAAFGFLGRHPFWHYSFRHLALAQGIAGAALILAGLMEAWWLFMVLFPLVGALSGLTYFSSIYYSLNLRESEGKKSGIHEIVLSSGVCFGPLLCGMVAEGFPSRPGAALIFGGLVVLGGLGFQALLHRRGGEPASRPAPASPTGSGLVQRSPS
jgi:predicted MFS family arabinose efflux permease